MRALSVNIYLFFKGRKIHAKKKKFMLRTKKKRFQTPNADITVCEARSCRMSGSQCSTPSRVLGLNTDVVLIRVRVTPVLNESILSVFAPFR